MPAEPRSAIGDLLVEDRTPSSGARLSTPAFIVDAAAGTLLDANSAGWTAWGLDPAKAAPPIGIDTAMPALRRLREIAGAKCADSQEHEKLVFWTARGVVALACRIVRHEKSGADAAFLVKAVAAAAPASRPVAPAPDTRAGSGGFFLRGRDNAEIDVALDAWLAHELRTPLSAVIAYAEILKNEHFGPLANPRYKTYARHIYDSARHALGVADSMLRGDRVRTALPSLSFVDVDPREIIEGCLTLARPLADRAGLTLTADLSGQLPRIVADEQSLRQMLLNLLSNAIKYSRRGDKVTISVAYDGPLTICVTDTGPGIGEGLSTDGAGLGLGLPLTRALAAANGATLTIESAAGKGTRVTITFGKDRVVPV